MTEEQVFLAALDLPDATARAAYLDQICGRDGDFRKQVDALLANHFKSGEFLDVPAAEQMKAGSGVEPTVAMHEAAESADRRKVEESELHFLTPSSRPDSLGRIGHYEVLQVLGRGGFGIVFRAFDDVLQRIVAIKVLAPEIAATSPARKRFLREAQSSAQVRHENVVQVHEVGEQPLPYLVMEFIPGETLQQRLDRVGPLDVLETLRIGRQIAEGLTAAHANDLIHRDIKPGNVLLEGGQQRVKITDFGLARAADDASLTQSGTIAGTPMYMAPEQALGHTLDQRADLFSLGSVLYQMVAGRPPFRANSTVAVLKRVADDAPRNIREIIPETPQWLCDIIAKLHAKDPAERFQSAREVADVLSDCEAQLKSSSKLKDYSRIPRRTAARSANPFVSAAAVLAVVAIALAVTEFAGLTHLFRRPSEARLDVALAGQGVPDEGWVQLFNGKDLEGWKSSDSSKISWTWADGILTAQGAGDLVTERDDYENFHLRLNIKTSMRSGAWVRVRDKGGFEGDYYITAIRSQRNMDTLQGGGLSASRGGKPTALCENAVVGSDDAWHTLEIIAIGNRIQTVVNGKPVADITEDHPLERGGIALSLLGQGPRVAHFKNVEIKELPAPALPAEEPEWVRLFNGKNLDGWRVVKGEWIPQAGALSCQTKEQIAYLRTLRGDFENFHFKARIRLVDTPSIGGILFRLGTGLTGYRAQFSTVAGETGAVSVRENPWPAELIALTKEVGSMTPGAWVDYEIIAKGPSITIQVDGKETARVIDSRFRGGQISLEVFPNSHTEFKDIKIKKLPPEEPGWAPLFNGKDLTGWRSLDKNAKASWTWADDVLTFKGLGDLLVTDRNDYADFHLRLSIKSAIGSGASIRFRNSEELYGNRYLTGIRGGLTVFRDKQPTGLAKDADVGPPDEWHTLEIIAVGNRIKTLVDGKPVADVTDPDHTRSTGSIALSSLSRNPQEVHFKNVEIKELPPEPAGAATVPQVDEIRRIDGGHGSIWRAVLSADGKHILASGEDGAVSLWTQAGTEVRTFKGHTKTVWGVALAEDGATAVSGGEDETVRVWDVATGEQRRVLEWKGNQVRSVALTGDGRYVLAGSMQGEIRLWETATGQEKWSRDGHAGNVHCVAFSPDGKLALSADGIWDDGKSRGAIRIWDVDTGKELNKLVGHDLYVGVAAFAPDGRTVLSGSRDQTLRLWDVASGQELRRIDAGIWTESISFSPDGRRFLTGGRDTTVRLWDLAAGQVISRFSGHTAAAVSVHYHSDALALSSSWDGTLRLWQLPLIRL